LKLQDVITDIKPNLSDAESQELDEHLTEYGDIFALDSNDYRQTDKVYHHIDMGEAQPTNQTLRRLPGKIGKCG
jgi:hypothetical protein